MGKPVTPKEPVKPVKKPAIPTKRKIAQALTIMLAQRKEK